MDINSAIHEAFILEDSNYKNIKEYLEFSLADEFSSDYYQRPICEEVCEYIMDNEPEVVDELGLEPIYAYIGAFDVTDGYVNIFSSDHTVLHVNNSEKAFNEGFRKNTKIIDPTFLQYKEDIEHPMGYYNDDIKPVDIRDLWDESDIFSLCDISSIDDKYLNKENIPKELFTDNFWIYPKPIGFDDNNKPIVWLFISE